MTTMPLGQVLSERAARAGGEFAITIDGRSITAGELESNANRKARTYAEFGVKEGDLVTVALPNGIEFAESLFAIWKLGATPAPISAALTETERNAIIALANPAIVVGVPEGLYPGRVCLPDGFVPPVDLADTPILPHRVSPSWKALMSGGSTGTPKLIVATRSSEFDLNSGSRIGMHKGGAVLVTGPLYHNAPFGMLAVAVATGCRVVLLRRFDAVAALEAIERYRIDQVTLVPTMMLRMWRAIQDNPDRFDISSLSNVWHMAASCPPWLKQAWIDLVGAENLFEMYGGTEGHSQTVITGTEWLAHKGSVGRPTNGEMQILNAEGQGLPPGEIGEIFMRPPHGSPPTYRYVGAEARARGEWESLGDLGWMDADGYLYISDRRTDMIVTGGANVYPAEIEAAIVEHPAVESAVVVGIPHEDLGRAVHAVVQTTGPLDSEELREFVSQRLVRYKVPRTFRFVDYSLRDDAGKVRRSSIRDEESSRLLG
jgi:bile acid-coenzyme A ligase